MACPPSTWAELLPYMDPAELADVLGLRGERLIHGKLSRTPQALMREADMDAVVVEVLEELHGPDPMVLVR